MTNDCDLDIFVFVVVAVEIGEVTNAMIELGLCDNGFPAGISFEEAPMTTDKHKQAIVITTNIKNGRLAPPPPSKMNGNNIFERLVLSKNTIGSLKEISYAREHFVLFS